MDRQRLFAAIAAAILIGAILSGWQPVAAQGGQELLQNNGMDSYYGLGGEKVVPVGWTLQSNIPINTAKQQWQYENTQFGGSWHLSTQSAAFSAIGYQFVPGVRSGTALRFTAFANVFTCNQQTSCIGSDGLRRSDQGSGAQVRIGIDPTGGQNAAAASVIWSGWAMPWDNFQQLVIEARSANDNGVTVFLNYTQSASMLLNNVYWDNASLLALGAGAVIGGTGQPAAPVFNAVATTPQAPQPDGSIVHTVRQGETLIGIAQAYKVTVAEIRELNNLSNTFIVIGQKLLIKKAPGNIIYVIVTNTPTLDPSITVTATATGSRTPKAGLATNTPGLRPTFGPVIIIKTPTPTKVAIWPTSAPTKISTTQPVQQPISGVTDIPTQAASSLQSVVVLGKSATSASSQPAVAVVTLGSLCFSAFEDANRNRYRDADEIALADVKLTLRRGGTDPRELTTRTEPGCADLEPGTYTVAGNAPQRYAFTTPSQVEVEIRPGLTMDVLFGAAPGDSAAEAVTVTEAPQRIALLDSIVQNSGIIVLGIAGLVVIGVLAVAVLLRR